MNKNTKIWFIVASSLILIGLIIFGGVMSMFKWDFTKLSFAKYETNYHIIKEEYQNISIEVSTADIEFIPSKTHETKVECYELSNVRHSVTVYGRTLKIEEVDSRKWFEHIGINFSSPKIKVYLPEGSFGNLEIKSFTSDIILPEGFGYESIDISATTGSITCYSVSNGPIRLHATTGDIKLENSCASSIEVSVSTGKVTVQNVECDGELNVKISTGKTKIGDVMCGTLYSDGSTGDLIMYNVISVGKLSIIRSTGDVKFENCDAAEVYMETDTGDVTGNFLSDKIFLTNTATGKTEVPKSITGGRCEVNTDTGDIKISIKQK